MEWTCFDVTVEEKVGHVRLNRPDALNTMIPQFWSELPQVIAELSDRGDVRAIVVSSTGKHFSAGMDLSVFTSSGLSLDGEPGRRNATFMLLVKRLQESFTALERARVPVLAAVQGGCIGGAVDMVCAADMRYASADAYFVIQETNIGMTADVGTLQRLPKLIPDGVAREMVYTGRRMSAQRALEVGLVNEVFDDHEALVAGALEIAAEISTAEPGRWAERIRHAGAMFLGPWSSESLGDYCAGPNHVLPTMRTARFSSPLGVYDFQKRSSVIEVSAAGARALGAIASSLAHGEGLPAHARSAELRMEAAP